MDICTCSGQESSESRCETSRIGSGGGIVVDMYGRCEVCGIWMDGRARLFSVRVKGRTMGDRRAGINQLGIHINCSGNQSILGL